MTPCIRHMRKAAMSPLSQSGPVFDTHEAGSRAHARSSRALNSSLFLLIAMVTMAPSALWSIDYPDAFDIYSGALSCGSARAGWNLAHYCDPTADRMVDEAEGLPLGAARTALYRQAQRHLLQSAAHVPVLFLKSTDLVSPQVGGFYYQPIYGWQYEDYWLKP